MKKAFYLLSLLLLVSCGTPVEITNYDISLSAVESPKDSKVKFGDTKIVTFEEEGVSKYRYEDDYIDIVWIVGETRFYFELYNKSDHTLKIPWDEVAYVNEDGAAMRVMHKGIKYIERNASQPLSVVPRNSHFSDAITPTENVYISASDSFREKRLFPMFYSQRAADNSGLAGKYVRIVFPVILEDVQNEYTFEFCINKVSVIITKKKPF